MRETTIKSEWVSFLTKLVKGSWTLSKADINKSPFEALQWVFNFNIFTFLCFPSSSPILQFFGWQKLLGNITITRLKAQFCPFHVNQKKTLFITLVIVHNFFISHYIHVKGPHCAFSKPWIVRTLEFQFKFVCELSWIFINYMYKLEVRQLFTFVAQLNVTGKNVHELLGLS